MAKMMQRQTDEEEVRETAERLGCSIEHARFIVAINKGEIDGDQVVIQLGEDVPE
jgi:hypothetical protein